MNKTKSIIFCSLFAILSIVILTICFFSEETYSSPISTYQVYLDGNKIGLINSKTELYDLINQEQTEIKDEYHVDQVYPPKGFKIVKKNTYDKNTTTVENVYDSIKDEKTFTIKGYTITIKSGVEAAVPIYIYVLDDKIFKTALENVITTFVGKERYEQYKTNTQSEITDTGYIIENMYFKDEISIKESYISIDQKIYTDATELTKYLLFGDNESKVEYTVAAGDTIENIAYKNQLNVEELLIANDDIPTVNTLLAIGQKINVALIDPVLTLVYEELVTEDVEEQYQRTTETDASKYTDYSEVKQKGVNGINRITSRVQFSNGEKNPQVKIVGEPQVIRETQNEIVVKGTKKRFKPGSSIGGGSSGNVGINVDNRQPWGWPTNSPYIITSEYGYRWGTLHDGMDISGTGYGSPIYASLEGEVIHVGWRGPLGSAAGMNIVICHSNGYCTGYAHLSATQVKVGQHVSRRQRIGSMGNTGNVTGTHLHFGVFTGVPYSSGVRSINPRRLWS